MSWQFSPETKQLLHSCGICLEIQGAGTEPHNIFPLHIPESLNASELAKLIREGMDYYRHVQQQRLRLIKNPQQNGQPCA